MENQKNKQMSDQLNNILDWLVAHIEIEQIYLRHFEYEGLNRQELVILIPNSCNKAISELVPIVGVGFANQTDYQFMLYHAHTVKEAIKNGNLFFYTFCVPANRLYENPNSTYSLNPENTILKESLEKRKQNFELEMEKFEAFHEGSKFYYDVENYSYATFMLHQAMELAYRATERFVLGKVKVTHSIQEHQNYIAPYMNWLSEIFPEYVDAEVKLLKVLDDSYVAVRYKNNYIVDADQVKRFFDKAALVRLIAPKIVNYIASCFVNQQLENQTDVLSTNTQGKALNADENLKSILRIIALIPETEAVYLFGARTYSTIHSNIVNLKISESTIRHYDLLVITSKDNGNSIADLKSSINDNAKNKHSVTLLVHSQSSINKAIADDDFFFKTIFNKAERIYSRNELPFDPPLFNLNNKNRYTKAQLYWLHRKWRANAFMEAATNMTDDESEVVEVFILHQVMEQLCLGLIYVFLGYKPNCHSLNHLLDICSHFTHLCDEYMPRRTIEDKEKMGILAKSVTDVRYRGEFCIDPADVALLHSRCKIFLAKSELICESELKRLEENCTITAD